MKRKFWNNILVVLNHYKQECKENIKDLTMKKITIKKLVILILLVSNFISVAFSQGVVCRKERIAGFYNEYNIGHAICGETTNSMADAKMYLTVSGDNIYVHSNYKVPGYENPTKLATSDILNSFEDLAANIFFDTYPSTSSMAEMKSMLKSNIEIILDPLLINDSKYGSLNFSNIKKLKVYCPDNEVRDAIKIQQKDGAIEIGVRYNNQFSTRIKAQNLNFIFSELRNQKIDFKKLKIVNLVDNSSTKKILSENFLNKILSFDFSSTETFKRTLLKNKGNRTVIIGHIEKGDFVTINSEGKEVFRISLDEIEAFQKENKLELILLGCNSASEGAGSGVIGKFNSVDALKRLKAAEETNNIEEFLDQLSSNTLHFVIDESFFKTEQDVSAYIHLTMPEKIEVSVFDNIPPGSKTINYVRKKGTMIILGLGSADILSNTFSSGDSTNVEIQQDSVGYINEDNTKSANGGNNPVLWAFLIIGGIVIAAYFINKSNRA